MNAELVCSKNGVDPCDGTARVDPPLLPEDQHVSGLSDGTAVAKEDGVHPTFFKLLTKACGANFCFTKESKVAHFDIDSWVAVHEYYVLDFFPPPGSWISPFSDVLLFRLCLRNFLFFRSRYAAGGQAR